MYRSNEPAGRVLGRLVWMALAASVLSCASLNPLQTRATRALDRGQARLAYDLLSQELAENPSDVRTLRLFARAASSLGDDSAALEAIARAERSGKEAEKLADVRRGIWQVAFQPARDVLDTLERADAEDLERARVALARAKKYDPGAAGSVAAEAALELRSGNERRADSLFASVSDSAAVDLRTRDVVVKSFLHASKIHAEAGRHREAITSARTAAALSVDDTQPLYDLGVTLHRAGEALPDTALIGEAAATFRLVLERLPEDLNARYNLALSSYRLGDFEESDRQLRDLLSRSAPQGRALQLLARLRLQRNDRAGATVPLAGTRAIEGDEQPVPVSVLDVSSAAGKEGRKRFVFDGPPARIFSYLERSGAPMEVWFYENPSRVVVFSRGRMVGEETFEGSSEGGTS